MDRWCLEPTVRPGLLDPRKRHGALVAGTSTLPSFATQPRAVGVRVLDGEARVSRDAHGETAAEIDAGMHRDGHRDPALEDAGGVRWLPA